MCARLCVCVCVCVCGGVPIESPWLDHLIWLEVFLLFVVLCASFPRSSYLGRLPCKRLRPGDPTVLTNVRPTHDLAHTVRSADVKYCTPCRSLRRGIFGREPIIIVRSMENMRECPMLGSNNKIVDSSSTWFLDCKSMVLLTFHTVLGFSILVDLISSVNCTQFVSICKRNEKLD